MERIAGSPYTRPALLPVTHPSDLVATVGSVGLWLVYEVSAVVGSRRANKIHYTLWDGYVSDTTNYSTDVQGGSRG
jgi:hypothetical protein